MQLFHLVCATGIALAGTIPAFAQNTSIYQRTTNGIPQASVSLLYSEATQPRKLNLHDKITIRVNELAEFTRKGELNRRNNSTYDAQLRDWVELDGLNLKASPTVDLPRARGNLNSQTRANGELTTRDRLAFNITVHIVDIRPNGDLVFEGNKQIDFDEEIVKTTITGIVRPDDIPPNRVVLSDKIDQLVVSRETKGIVRDSYKRGWLTEAWDKWTPF